MERMWKLREELLVWFNGREDHRAHLIQDLFWLARLTYLVDIFGLLNVLNIALQECRIDKFEETSKITSGKEKLQSLEEEICNNNLKTLTTLQTLMFTCKWEESEQDLEHRIIKAASFHALTLLASFVTSFPNHQATELKSKLWILNLFG